MTLGGKSTLARELCLSAAEPRLIVDPQGSEITAVDGAVTFSDPAQMPDPGAVGTVRYVPADPTDLAGYNEVFRRARAYVLDRIQAGRPQEAHIWTWNDEAGITLPANGSARDTRYGRIWCVAGAKLMMGGVNIHTRPRDVVLEAKSNSHHWGIWPLALDDDLAHVAACASVRLAELVDALAQVDEHGFVWISRVAGRTTMTVCDPVLP